MAKNDNLHKAKDAKNDEFYTRIEDVAEELRHYKKHFAGKVVFCNCDDPTWSAFWRYFHLNFAELGLKKLISTHYDRTEPTYKMEYEGGDDNNVEVGVKAPLEGNGDFRSKECLDLLDECDIVVTNPPFSLFREFVGTLMEHKKKFLIIGNSVKKGRTGCPVCAGKTVVPGINDLASQCPEAAAMWSDKNACSPSDVYVSSRTKALFKCPDCKQEFKTIIRSVVKAVKKDRTGCPICAGKIVVPGINDLATKYPKVAAMWSNKNACFPSEVSTGTIKKAWFKCPDCKREFEATISSVVRSVRNDCTGCYDCNMRRANTISKPEWFFTRFMLAFAGESGIANPFFDVRNIFGKNSRRGLDFVDHVQRLCYEYNGNQWHSDDKHAAKDRSKFRAARKAGYAMIRILEPGLEVLDPKYDIVMPEGFRHGNAYIPEIMEEVGRKIIHLLEEIYDRKASPEIWALNNFKEFEAWYDANKKELEANAQKKGPKGKAAAKMAA